MGAKGDYSVDQLEDAKQRYLRYESIRSISMVCKVPRSTITYHAKRTWELQRELEKADLFSQVTSAKRVDFTKMTQSAITIMSKAMSALATRHEPPTLKEATQAGDILATLDKITRLDEGSATDIISNQDKPITIVEVQKKISADPFADKLEQFKELKHDD